MPKKVKQMDMPLLKKALQSISRQKPTQRLRFSNSGRSFKKMAKVLIHSIHVSVVRLHIVISMTKIGKFSRNCCMAVAQANFAERLSKIT
jgi:hypothetical protein